MTRKLSKQKKQHILKKTRKGISTWKKHIGRSLSEKPKKISEHSKSDEPKLQKLRSRSTQPPSEKQYPR